MLLTRIAHPELLTAETLARLYYWWRPHMDPKAIASYLPWERVDDAEKGALIERMQFVLDSLKAESIVL